MGSLLFFAFSWWGILLQAFAIIHFIRRRPDTFWLWIILIGGWLGALVYIAVEAIPDAGLLRQSFKVFPRRKRIRELEAAILDNPSAGNYEELADLYLEEGQFARARQAYDKSISSRTDSPDPFYRRAVAAIQMADFAAALPDLERVVSQDPTYDFHRAAGLLAHAYANTGAAGEGCGAIPGKSPRFPPRRRPITTTPAFSPPSNATPKRESGRSKFWPKNPACRDICAAANDPGSARRMPC